MLRRGRIAANITSKINDAIMSKNVAELPKLVCSIKGDSVSEADWNSLVDTLSSFLRDTQCESGSASIAPALVITAASTGLPLSRSSRSTLSRRALECFSSFSVFDKAVFSIGCSQTGLRDASVLEFVNRFSTDGFADVSESLLPALMLAVATLGIKNHHGWNGLIARLKFENLKPGDLSNIALAVVTSRTFPIATVEKLLDKSAAMTFSFHDALSLLHSLCCLEVFRTDLVRGLLKKISESKEIDKDASKLLKQSILALFLDPKARAVTDSVSPRVMEKLQALVDWTLPEPQRHQSEIEGEVQEIISQQDIGLDHHEEKITKPLPLPTNLSDWNRETAVSAAMDRFYVGSLTFPERKIFVHVDDETYPDCDEGPLDAYLQLKHCQVVQCGWRLVWIRVNEWESLENYQEKKNWIDSLLS